MRKHFAALISILVLWQLVILSDGNANAADRNYPTRAVTLVVPFSPGGGTDTTARAIASVVPKYLGQSFIVTNKPGGSGAIAHVDIAKAKPDGYTLIVTGNSPSTVVPYLGKVNYDPLNDFEFIALITNLRNCIGVAGNSPINTIQELIAAAKANPGKIKMGNSGANGIDDLLIRMINSKVGINIAQVPFDSSGEIITAVMGGHIAAYAGTTTAVMPMVGNKTMKILAITSDERDPVFPDIRTLKENGFDISLNNFNGIAAPKGTPKEIIAFLQDVFKKSTEDENLKTLAKRLNLPVGYLDGQAFKKAVEADSEKVKAVLSNK